MKKTTVFLILAVAAVFTMLAVDRCTAREDAIPMTDQEVFEGRLLKYEEDMLVKRRADYEARLKDAHKNQLATGWTYVTDYDKKAILRGSPVPATPIPGVAPKK